ncbi:MAG: SEL1-like repeat protein [Planctomycetes bacterium]|nr:SEL1-like repeat protein [Planctomycetota bacterium]
MNAPTHLGPFPLLGTLGVGGMGTVYLSRHPQLGFEVAVKVLGAGRGASQAQRSRFQREIRALTLLDHPGLVEVLGAGEEAGVPWFAMRRVAGESLEDRLRTRGQLSGEETLDLALQLCDALAAAHAIEIIHRDLKPDNLLCTPDGRYVLTDFGLTKLLGEVESVRLSLTGALQGTPGYWAPEQARGSVREGSFPTDVYGVGAILYAALTGRPPVQGKDLMELIVATQDRVPEPPSALAPNPLPPGLEAVVLKCLEKDASARFATVDALADALRQVQEGGPRRGSGRLWALVAVSSLASFVLVGLALAGVAGLFEPQPDPTLVPASPDTPASDALYTRGEAAREEGRESEAIALFGRAAESGHVEAMATLATMYRESDPSKVREWTRRAAEGGWIPSVFTYGLMVESGDGGPKDEALAREWYRRGTQLDDPRAAYHLARMNLMGLGGAKNLVQARALFRRSAEAGHPPAMHGLAQVLERGIGGAEDSVESVKWYREAATEGGADSMLELAEAYSLGQGVERNYEHAVRWYRRAAADGHHPQALRELGVLVTNGQGVPRDDAAAIQLFRDAIAGGYTKACHDLGMMIEDGRGCEPDSALAAKWYRRGAEAGDMACMETLGVSLAMQPDDESHKKGAQWLRKASDLGLPGATHNLARLYTEGRGVTRDRAEAMRLFKQAAEAGFAPAMEVMGEQLLAGTWVPRDEKGAMDWLRRGAEAGDVTCMHRLGASLSSGLGGGDARAGTVWFYKAAAAGYGPSMTALGVLRSQLSDDDAAALTWFLRASVAGDQDGRLSAASYLSEGRGTEPNAKEAERLLRLVLKEGNTDQRERAQAQLDRL